MTGLLLALCVQAVPLAPTAPAEWLDPRRLGVDAKAAEQAAAEALIRLADPGARFFDSAEAARAAAASNAAPASLTELDAGVWLLRAPLLDAAAADQVATGLVRPAASGGGLILDLRGSTGDNLDAVDAVAAPHVASDTFLYRLRDGRGEECDLRSAPAAPRAAAPLLVLIDEDTRGTAELLAALFAAAPRGVLLVGARTRGDAARRELRPLADGRVVRLATGWFAWPDGTTWRGTGIAPHVAVSAGDPVRVDIPTNATTRTGKPLAEAAKRHLALFARVREDAALARAVDLVLGLKALAILPEAGHAPR